LHALGKVVSGARDFTPPCLSMAGKTVPDALILPVALTQ
jgi:hypothetical protein